MTKNQNKATAKTMTITPVLPVVSGNVMAITAALFIGFATLTVVGHVQAHSLHDAAHDTRHATGFPCH